MALRTCPRPQGKRLLQGSVREYSSDINLTISRERINLHFSFPYNRVGKEVNNKPHSSWFVDPRRRISSITKKETGSIKTKERHKISRMGNTLVAAQVLTNQQVCYILFI